MRQNKTAVKILAILALIALPLLAQAQAQGFNTSNPLGNSGSNGGGLFNSIFGCPVGNGGGSGIVGSGSAGVLCILRNVLLFILTIAFIVALIFLVIGGFRYVTSQGNEDALEKAKGTITYAIVGVVLIALAFVVLNLVLQVANSGSP